MSQVELDRLVAERSLAREDFDDRQVAGFWSKSLASFADARVPSISADGAFQLAYTAALQATFAVLATQGLRVKSTASHYKAFYAMQRLGDDALRRYAIRFDELRATRHESIYQPVDDEIEMTRRSAEALSMLEGALPTLRAWLVAQRSSLDQILSTAPPPG